MSSTEPVADEDEEASSQPSSQLPRHGHWLRCQDCQGDPGSGDSERCPTCEGTGAAWTLDEDLEEGPIPCRFDVLGCTAEFAFDKLEEHEDLCPYNADQYECQNCDEVFTADEMVEHIERHHPGRKAQMMLNSGDARARLTGPGPHALALNYSRQDGASWGQLIRHCGRRFFFTLTKERGLFQASVFVFGGRLLAEGFSARIETEGYPLRHEAPVHLEEPRGSRKNLWDATKLTFSDSVAEKMLRNEHGEEVFTFNITIIGPPAPAPSNTS